MLVDNSIKIPSHNFSPNKEICNDLLSAAPVSIGLGYRSSKSKLNGQSKLFVETRIPQALLIYR